MTDNDYRSEQLADGVYAIDDVSGESMYLLNGTTRSVLIDTGMKYHACDRRTWC